MNRKDLVFPSLGILLAILVVCLLGIFGCSANNYFVDFNQDTSPPVGTKDGVCQKDGNANGSNVLVISFDQSPISTTKDQKSTGEIPVGYNGGTAGSGSGGLKDTISKFAPDLSQKDSNNPVTNTSSNQLPAATKPVVDDDTSIDVSGDGSPSEGTPVVDTVGSGEKFDLSNSDKGYKTLRATKIGTDFGKSIKVVYPNGFSFIVPDTSKRFSLNGKETVYRAGGVGLSKSSERYTSHGGMGIWTQKAGSSSFVTIYPLQ